MDKQLYCPGRILYLEDYDFGEGASTKNKYSIVLGVKAEETLILHCFPTKVDRVNFVHATTHGCNHTGFYACYLWAAQRIIGESGFFFPKDTYMYLRSNLTITEYPYLEIYNINGKMQDLDILIESEYRSLMNCILTSNLTQRDIKRFAADIYQNT